MKFIGIILLLLTSIFLIACSANQASNKINNSELENLASKYGGVYVFNEKFEKEIEKQEKIRDSKRKEILERIKTIPNKNERNKKMREILKLEFYNNPEMQQVLSNGKPYYTRWTDYENKTGKKSVIPEIYINKIKEFIGMQDYNKHKPYIDLIKFYIESDGSIVPIVMTVDYYVKKKNYGLYGDEGRGFSLSQTTLKNISGDNKFILNNNKFEKVK
ncbi:tRNA 2-selenouridine synthase [Campylobacter concisus]|uniref:tRNA 2-selenouridine synthase n=1 Tax=Campylobacter concisus TaxID=199 RepID=A0A7S9RE92_9BACT|nr:tRNA 2-selenouridine synthase [Campylobacter concisus]QPH90104.1 tRNA 2-selenouridine synthase [Campylobacter concisus]